MKMNMFVCIFWTLMGLFELSMWHLKDAAIYIVIASIFIQFAGISKALNKLN